MTLKGNFISVKDAAAQLGCTEGHVRLLLIKGKLAGQKFTERSWAVSAESVKAFGKVQMPTGRPRKNSA